MQRRLYCNKKHGPYSSLPQFFSLLLMDAANLAHMAVMDENERPVELHLLRTGILTSRVMLTNYIENGTCGLLNLEGAPSPAP